MSTPMRIMKANIQKEWPGVILRPLKELTSQLPDVSDITTNLEYGMMFFCKGKFKWVNLQKQDNILLKVF